MTGTKPKAAPLRSNIGCVNADALALRSDKKGVSIYGPFEAGFSSAQMSCLGSNSLPGGIDTQLAEMVMSKYCGKDITLLDYCGGHTNYHYHEHMSCLYKNETNGHSSRIGTAGDGNGIYGPYIAGGVMPTDLDGCGGRTGITPDSNGVAVYYYPVKEYAPFTVGCFGPGTLEQCKALYPGCTADDISLTTNHGTGQYKLDCPCFDANRSNTAGNSGRPGFMAPIAGSVFN